MSKYTVKIYTGDYRERQEAANRDGAICYYEQHCNSILYDDPDTLKDNPVLAILAHNASEKSAEWASAWAIATADVHNNTPPAARVIPRVKRRQKYKRGDLNLRYTNMPAILAEPGFLSDPLQATRLLNAAFRMRLASAAVTTIMQQFPKGGLVALSVGHKQESKPFDRGAPITAPNVANPNDWAEWDVSHDIVSKMSAMFDSPNRQPNWWSPVPIAMRLPCPHCGGQVRIKLEGTK